MDGAGLPDVRSQETAFCLVLLTLKSEQLREIQQVSIEAAERGVSKTIKFQESSIIPSSAKSLPVGQIAKLGNTGFSNCDSDRSFQ